MNGLSEYCRTLTHILQRIENLKLTSGSTVRDSIHQFVRYAIAGLVLNSCGYLLYLGITEVTGSPKAAVSICYPTGVLCGFFLHARYSFAYSGNRKRSLILFIVAHVFGYISNIVVLWIGVDVLKFRHELIQVFAIFFVAAELFVMLKCFAFSTTPVRAFTSLSGESPESNNLQR